MLGMNVTPRSENAGNTIGIRSGRPAGDGVRLQGGSSAAYTGVESEDDEDFMALMNEDKKKSEQQQPFVNGLPGSQPSVSESPSFQRPAGSEDGMRTPPFEPAPVPPAQHGAPEASSGYGSQSFRSLEEEKQHYVHKINRLQSRFPGRRVGLETPLDELKYEFERLRRQSELGASIKFQRRMLMAFVSGTEYLNKSFNPLNLQLDGWSEQVMDSIEDFDQTFEQLHDKYQGTSEVSPEWNLMIMLLGSGFMFHLSNSLFKSVLPNVNDVAKNNPDLMNQIASAMGNAMGQQAGASQGGGQTGVGLAMQAMQQQLRPQSSVGDDETESSLPGFEQASALRQPPAVGGRVGGMATRDTPLVEEDEMSSVISDGSSELSLSSDEVRTASGGLPGGKRGSGRARGSAKRPKKSVSINL